MTPDATPEEPPETSSPVPAKPADAGATTDRIDDSPAGYTHGHADAVLRSHRWRTAANSAAYLIPHLRDGASLLDVGCGPGTLTVDLARHVGDGRVVGIDLSASVIDEARAHAAASSTGARVEFACADLADYACTDHPRAIGARGGDGARPGFDVVHAHQVLQHVTDPVATLVAMASHAAPGGLVAARDSDYPAMSWHPDSPGLERWREVYLGVTRRNGADAAAGRRLRGWAHAAGLREVAYSSSTWTFATAEDVQWWSELWAERSTGTRFAEQAVAYGLATSDELHRIGAAWRAWATSRDAVFNVPHGEILARRAVV